jgi:Phytanoyl-CoA dioxygenase (PhyH)
MGRMEKSVELVSSQCSSLTDCWPASQFEVNGCCLLTSVMPIQLVQHCCDSLDELLGHEREGILRSQGTAYGVRNLLQLWPELVELVKLHPAHSLAQQILGKQFGVVRALLFDKPPARSWNLPWHRDRTIAVSRQCSAAAASGGLPAGLTNLTLKAGVPHALAPDWLLERMIIFRFSLDPMTEQNGPLVFLPGSHKPQVDSAAPHFQTDDDLKALHSPAITVQRCAAGDLFVMRPLLAHSSLISQSGTALRRRVVHIELSAQTDEIPWFQYVPV